MNLRMTLCCLAVTMILQPGQANAQTTDISTIQQMLDSGYKVTTVTQDRSDITTPGDIVEIEKPGMIMYAVASPGASSNTYNRKNGKIGQGWSGFGKDLLITTAMAGNGTANDFPHRTFAVGEKCWITGVRAEKDGVQFQLYSDPYDGIRYYGNLKIPYPNKKQVPSAAVEQQIIAEVLKGQPAAPAEAATPPASNTAEGAQAAVPAEPSAPPAPAMPAIAPPPAPADAAAPPPPTISAGQTPDKVIAAMGKPKSISHQGVKTVYTYPDLKVVFTNGKVTDVQ